MEDMENELSPVLRIAEGGAIGRAIRAYLDAGDKVPTERVSPRLAIVIGDVVDILMRHRWSDSYHCKIGLDEKIEKRIAEGDFAWGWLNKGPFRWMTKDKLEGIYWGIYEALVELVNSKEYIFRGEWPRSQWSVVLREIVETGQKLESLKKTRKKS